ncbi:MAG: hypothetical protein R6W73_01080 [Candidatus Saliniplasma sp.]
MVDEKGSDDGQKYWKSSTNKSSERLFLTFVTVFIIMLIITISLGIYTYMRYQELHERPQIRAEDALFEFKESTSSDEVNITVHLTLVNKGEEKSGDLTLEWIVMEFEREDENIFLIKEEKELEPMGKDEEREVRFDITLQEGSFTIGYRTYDEDIFSYEGRQDIEVTEDDVSEGVPEDEKEGADEDGATPMLSAPIALIVIVITALLWSKMRRKKEGRR